MNQKLKILAIGAHPDDCEFHFGGTAAKYLTFGHTVRFVSATNGSAGHHLYQSRGQIAAVRLKETAAVSALTGVEYEVLSSDDGCLTADLQTRDNMIRVIRKFQPDMIFTHRTNDYHTDHRNTAQLVQDASYLLGVPMVCPDVPCLRSMPVILSFFDHFTKPVPFHPDVAVDITDTIGQKVKMLHCHVSQMYEWLPWVDGESEPVPAAEQDRLAWLAKKVQSRDATAAERCKEQLLLRYGAEYGGKVRYAEAFEVSEYGALLNHNNITSLFPF